MKAPPETPRGHATSFGPAPRPVALTSHQSRRSARRVDATSGRVERPARRGDPSPRRAKTAPRHLERAPQRVAHAPTTFRAAATAHRAATPAHHANHHRAPRRRPCVASRHPYPRACSIAAHRGTATRMQACHHATSRHRHGARRGHHAPSRAALLPPLGGASIPIPWGKRFRVTLPQPVDLPSFSTLWLTTSCQRPVLGVSPGCRSASTLVSLRVIVKHFPPLRTSASPLITPFRFIPRASTPSSARRPRASSPRHLRRRPPRSLRRLPPRRSRRRPSASR